MDLSQLQTWLQANPVLALIAAVASYFLLRNVKLPAPSAPSPAPGPSPLPPLPPVLPVSPVNPANPAPNSHATGLQAILEMVLRVGPGVAVLLMPQLAPLLNALNGVNGGGGTPSQPNDLANLLDQLFKTNPKVAAAMVDQAMKANATA